MFDQGQYVFMRVTACLTNCLVFHCFVLVFTFTMENHDFIFVSNQLNVIMMLLQLTRVDS